MPLLQNSLSRNDVPIAYQFSFNGVGVNWGSFNLLSISNSSLNVEPQNGDYSFSNLETTFSDTNGSIWGSLGYGSACIGSRWSATVFVGGTSDYGTYGNGEYKFKRVNTEGAGTYVVHTGRIISVSRRDRKVKISSENLMGQLKDLEIRFPIGGFLANGAPGTIYGTYMFFSGDLRGTSDYSSYVEGLAFDYNDKRDQFSSYLYPWVDAPVGAYDTPAGRGTMGRAYNSSFVSDTFYQYATRYLFKGSYLGSFLGTVDTLQKANDFGWADLTASEAWNYPSGTYTINKTRYSNSDNFDWSKPGTRMLPQAEMRMGSTLPVVWRELLTGCCVNGLFTTSDIESASYATSLTNDTLSTVDHTFHPKGGKMLDVIKNLISPTRASFGVNSLNQFKLQTFGPKSSSASSGTITVSSIVSSDLSVDNSRKFTRMLVEYNYNPTTGSYTSKLEKKHSSWSVNNDFPFSIQSKWLRNSNEVSNLVDRMLSRYNGNVAVINVETPLTWLNLDIGSMVALSDPDLYPSERLTEVIGWERRFDSPPSVKLTLLDAQALYSGKGYAKWGTGTAPSTVSSSSIGGWGTQGTVTNIDQSFYGSQFVWF